MTNNYTLMEELNPQWARQLRLENKSNDLARDLLQKKFDKIAEGNGSMTSQKSGRKIMNEATMRVTHALQDYLDNLSNVRSSKPAKTILRLLKEVKGLKVADFALVTVRTVFRLAERFEGSEDCAQTVALIGREITKACEAQVKYVSLKSAVSPQYIKIVKEAKAHSANAGRTEKVFRKLAENHGIDPMKMGHKDTVAFGIKLLAIVLEHGGFVEKKVVKVKKKSESKYKLVFMTEVKEYMDDINQIMLDNATFHLPMIHPPANWEPNGTRGGYLSNIISSTSLMITGFRYRKYRNQITAENLSEVREAIHTVQNIPYKINTQVLEVLEQLWARGGGVAKLPPSSDKPEGLPPLLSDEEYAWFKEHDPETLKERRMHNAVAWQKHKSTLGRQDSIRRTLVAARWVKDEPEIYFPYTADFRGRLYCSCEMLSPQGDSVTKALLQYSKGKSLRDARGVRWFKIHGANVWGAEGNHDERVQWTAENEARILAVAEDPTSHTWWHDADKPWQFLTFCFEYAGFKKHGVNHVSRLMVAQDGKCNGLQHFSAMTRDRRGGVATNLVPGEAKQDPYEIVLETVKDLLRADGGEIARAWLAVVDRGLVKRPVMTTPYGVTEQGIQEQIISHITKAKSEDPTKYTVNIDGGPREFGQACRWLSRIISKAVGETVEASQVIKLWLQDISLKYAAADKHLYWYSPLGFKVVQYYPKTKVLRIDTGTGEQRITSQIRKDLPQVDGLGQKNGVSPNFVHSLDATHLIMTINEGRKIGLDDIVTIHDSFSCHPCDVDLMNKVLRETLVDLYLYSDPIRNIYDQAKRDLPGVEIQLPTYKARATFDLNEILKSEYCFS